MSELKKYLPDLQTTQGIARLFFFLFLIGLSISTLMNNGSLSHGSGTDIFPQDSLLMLTFIIFTYTVIIFFLRTMTNPNKAEMFIIPTLFLILLMVVFSFFGNPITDKPVENPIDPIIPSITESDRPRTVSLIDGNSTQSLGQASRNLNVESNTLLFQIVFGFISFIVVIIAFLMLMHKRNIREPEFSLANEIDYSGNMDGNALEIMAIYVETSNIIEGLKGIAPRWYSPTGYSEVVNKDPGKSVASYFKILTDLYEVARFSKRPVTKKDISEALELQMQVKMWADNVRAQELEAEASG